MPVDTDRNLNLDYPKTTFKTLEEARLAALSCKNCELCQSRTNVVFSQGCELAPVMLIGEAPGKNEDESGIPFVGRAGKLLDDLLSSGKIDREKDLYICNMLKCRPPKNRVPTPSEMNACWVYLAAQINFVKPKIILLAGSTPMKAILKTKIGITKLRGSWFENVYGAKAMPIFHPSYLLRYQSVEQGTPKWLMMQDIDLIKKAIDELD
ncbi:MAG: uracil-DNA glycosylase family protein [Vampirovibrionia bacterium]